MPDSIQPEVSTSAMVADADITKVMRLCKWFDLTCEP